MSQVFVGPMPATPSSGRDSSFPDEKVVASMGTIVSAVVLVGLSAVMALALRLSSRR
ncbi:hypothetical protein VSH64_26195 [Amycolatopsis rhabdoformis]|uniref:Uncharacterized protein n=1 Tax=Amycolatopsis rhabdoformis TaxID=1448059 RepID=A0ABZ1HVT7_9PSEU|nr:hypothetical protein [Amycolatopsis rhabdoformis]WSE26371.1 hypothetical protein VSH64_26195 [Amycolatopsis rhabdoformis]